MANVLLYIGDLKRCVEKDGKFLAETRRSISIDPDVTLDPQPDLRLPNIYLDSNKVLIILIYETLGSD